MEAKMLQQASCHCMNESESQIQASAGETGLLGDLVQIMLLHAWPHQEQRTITEFDAEFGLLWQRTVFQVETAGNPEAEGRDLRIESEFGFVVAVPGNAIVAVAVPVEQY